MVYCIRIDARLLDQQQGNVKNLGSVARDETKTKDLAFQHANLLY